MHARLSSAVGSSVHQASITLQATSLLRLRSRAVSCEGVHSPLESARSGPIVVAFFRAEGLAIRCNGAS